MNLMEELKKSLTYNPETGIFTWKETLCSTAIEDERAGGRGPHGYRRIQLNKKRYYEHDAAWIITHGEIPEGYEVDHKNPDEKWNNSISNLRLATKSQNQHNRGKQKNNTSGVKGVSLCKQTGKWKAALTLEGVYYAVGRFDSIEEAAEKVKAKREELHGEFSRHE